MEHGLQTHTVPDAEGQRALIARRTGYTDLHGFVSDLTVHTANVRRTYDRLFAGVEQGPKPVDAQTESDGRDKDVTLALSAARVLAAHSGEPADLKSVAHSLLSFANESLNPHRALVQAAHVA